MALVTLRSLPASREHLRVGTAGHVDHGKSTLLGTLITGHLDDGAGRTRLYLDVLPHEVERGLSAELSYGLLGFRNGGEVLRLRDPFSKPDRARVAAESERLVSFVDTVGHEPWLRTTIRGIVGQKLDYGLLVVAADDGVTHITREHLGILLAMELPTLVVLTKVDRATPRQMERTEAQVAALGERIGRGLLHIRAPADLPGVLEHPGLLRSHIPVLRASAVTGEGLPLLEELLRRLPVRNGEVRRSFQMYIDKVYQVTGVGTVVSGTVRQGTARVGDLLHLGPRPDGSYAEVRVNSIEMHYHRIPMARPGEVVGVAVKGVRSGEIHRGMCLCNGNARAVREFEAEVAILHHPTRIRRGYEPVVHLETVCETARFQEMESDYMMAGQTGRVRMSFKFHPYFVQEGQKFVFREGRSKGVGRVTRVVH
ncbi:MAG: GTP-binding protein [Euryarchaeota archaeon]|nr:GTP-binding protein [Euryarchaeota archaeon]